MAFSLNILLAYGYHYENCFFFYSNNFTIYGKRANIIFLFVLISLEVVDMCAYTTMFGESNTSARAKFIVRCIKMMKRKFKEQKRKIKQRSKCKAKDHMIRYSNFYSYIMRITNHFHNISIEYRSSNNMHSHITTCIHILAIIFFSRMLMPNKNLFFHIFSLHPFLILIFNVIQTELQNW